MNRALSVLLALGMGGAWPGNSQQLRAGNCAATPGPAEDWTPVTLSGLGLSLRLPAELKAQAYQSLRGIARRAKARSMPATALDTVELLAAWEAPRNSSSDIRQVLLYSRRPDSVPAGRPCAMTIAQQRGMVFRMAYSGDGRAADEYEVVAYWPGFLFAARGRSLDAYDAIYRVLRTVSAP